MEKETTGHGKAATGLHVISFHQWGWKARQRTLAAAPGGGTSFLATRQKFGGLSPEDSG